MSKNGILFTKEKEDAFKQNFADSLIRTISEEQIKRAKELLHLNKPISEISKETNLSTEQIKDIQAR